METTARLGLDKPVTSDPSTALRTAIRDHADILDSAVLYSEGVIASRPTSTPGSPGVKGRVYRATDEDATLGGRLYLDHGTGWQQIHPAVAADNSITSAKIDWGAWTDLPLTSPWSAFSAETAPRFRREGDRVFLRGAASRSAQATDIGTLPSGSRPSHNTFFAAWAATSGGGPFYSAMVGVYTTGVIAVNAIDSEFNPTTGLVALDGINFPV